MRCISTANNLREQRRRPGRRRAPPVNDGPEAIGMNVGAEPMRTAWPPIIRSRRCNGCSMARRSAARIRSPEETPRRADALRLYTMGSAWFLAR